MSRLLSRAVGLSTISPVLETIEAKHFTRNTAKHLPVHKETTIGVFGTEPKKELVIGPETSNKKEIRLVKKDVSGMDFNEDTTPADEFYRVWRGLKDAGLPVVPSVRKVSSHEVVMTDLTADGSQLYGKNRFMEHRSGPLDHLFIQIDPQEIEDKVVQLRKKANQAGIILPPDDPCELLLHPNGTYDLIILDIRDAKLKGYDVYDKWVARKSVESYNQKSTNMVFLNDLDHIRDLIESDLS